MDMTMARASDGRVRWALVGFGSGGRIFHAPLLASAPTMDFTAIVTSDESRRAAASTLYPGTRCVDTLEELADLGVAGVSISTPPATHVPLALQAIALGLHVVVDKPVGLDAAEVTVLREAARARNRVVVPYFNRRWDGDFLTIKSCLDAGRLGPVHTFVSRVDRCRPVKPGWYSARELGGGLLLDLGPHLVDQAVQLLGPVESVVALVSTVRPGATAEDEFTIQLRHDTGATSTLTAGLGAPAVGPRFLVQGRDAGLRIEGFDIQEHQLKSGGSPASLGPEWGADPNRTALAVDTDAHERALPLERGRWDTFYPAVADAVRGHGQPPATLDQAHYTTEILDASRSFAESTGGTQVLSSG